MPCARDSKLNKLGSIELLGEAASWRQSQTLRDYIRSGEQRALEQHGQIEEERELALWIAWARPQGPARPNSPTPFRLSSGQPFGKGDTANPPDQRLPGGRLGEEPLLSDDPFYPGQISLLNSLPTGYPRCGPKLGRHEEFCHADIHQLPGDRSSLGV